jgi:hypothetical protein
MRDIMALYGGYNGIILDCLLKRIVLNQIIELRNLIK